MEFLLLLGFYNLHVLYRLDFIVRKQLLLLLSNIYAVNYTLILPITLLAKPNIITTKYITKLNKLRTLRKTNV